MNKIKQIKLQGAKEILQQKLHEKLGDSFEWLHEYEKISEWLSDNKCKGLLLSGGQGVGKTLICEEIMPDIFRQHLFLNLVCLNPFNLAQRIDSVNNSCPVMVDDLGLEGARNDYGNKYEPFVELVYNAEKNGQILILTTNLTLKDIKDRYGNRTLDRLMYLVEFIQISHKSFRPGIK